MIDITDTDVLDVISRDTERILHIDTVTDTEFTLQVPIKKKGRLTNAKENVVHSSKSSCVMMCRMFVIVASSR